MSLIGEANKISVVKIVQELLLAEDAQSIPHSLISEKINLVLALNPRWTEDLDRESVINELIRRHSEWVGTGGMLGDESDHVAWLTAQRKKEWRYWQRYREMQETRLSASAVANLDETSDQVLSMLEDPCREGAWDRRGLVVGHVQSGKTGNYTGLICKAADAGYKVIIVLAGMHNNLRSQTQMRLDEGFLGYETHSSSNEPRPIGVGLIDRDPAIRPHYATTRSEKGDFSMAAAKNLGISPEERPWLFVVKKNKKVLERLHKWIVNHVANTVEAESGRKIVTHLPLLVIDDEADNASVDTGEQIFGENGLPDEEHQPKAINGLIRKILHAFQRKAYVGYTATPFANIFIHERNATPKEGPDLFPAAFIVNLGAPSSYVGPTRLFGINNGGTRADALPLVRKVDDHCSDDGKAGWMPISHKNGHNPKIDNEFGMPESLVRAIDSFVLTCALRKLRGQGDSHSSMLIHVTRFNQTQAAVHAVVDQYIRQQLQRVERQIGHEGFLGRLAELWQKDFLPVSTELHAQIPDMVSRYDYSWEQIVEQIADIVSELSVRMINGTAKDALDYADSGKGLKVIAIGGDKLARGLTLEGLCVSYFLRASKMYDTLMQMGRWFGYRPGYLDLCRLYTTADLVEWFEHIADASEELREEFDMMVASGGTPRDYGLKVVSHPVLMVTSPLKMRSAKTLRLSFSGHVVETVSMHKESVIVRANFDSFQSFVSVIGKPSTIPERKRGDGRDRWTGAYWSNVSHAEVTSFLAGYTTHPSAYKVNSQMLCEFIDSMALDGYLLNWNVAVVGGSIDKGAWQIEDLVVPLTQRANRQQAAGRYAIGRLLSPRDEALDLDEVAWLAALDETKRLWHADPARPDGKKEPVTPNGPALRKIRGFGAERIPASPETGLLLIYLLNPVDAGLPEGHEPVVAFGISFPSNNSGIKVDYKVGHIFWEQEFGSAE
ncbi:MZA anti-phage system associated Z1 domain-containing protein MzaC [Aeromonas caviae]|uniref:MZA anti-phage system associated Z1 domain-containing protein MzaC n=1 Tax=Aeromonas caviae TaxID=648 RepID=UPI0038CFA464